MNRSQPANNALRLSVVFARSAKALECVITHLKEFPMMNMEQRRFARDRVNNIIHTKVSDVTARERNDKAVNAEDEEDLLSMLKGGKLKFLPKKKTVTQYTELYQIFDMSFLKEKSKAAEARHDKIREQIRKEGGKLLDKIMLGKLKEEQIIDLIQKFEDKTF
jgi:hypothetical protein